MSNREEIAREITDYICDKEKSCAFKDCSVCYFTELQAKKIADWHLAEIKNAENKTKLRLYYFCRAQLYGMTQTNEIKLLKSFFDDAIDYQEKLIQKTKRSKNNAKHPTNTN